MFLINTGGHMDRFVYIHDSHKYGERKNSLHFYVYNFYVNIPVYVHN